jgi:hypothetical protein
MLVYFTTLFVVVLATYLARESKSRILSGCLLGLAFTSMVLTAGLRDRTVGTDTGAYVRYFADVRTLADVATVGREMGEYGFWILTWLGHFVSNEYVVFLFAVALIVVGCYQRVITAYSVNIGISFFVFITMGFYTNFFNTTRQGIACAVYALAIGPILERNFKKYIMYVLLAFLFHKSAIVLLPMYFVFSKTSTVKNSTIILLAGCILVFFFEWFIEVGRGVDAR